MAKKLLYMAKNASQRGVLACDFLAQDLEMFLLVYLAEEVKEDKKVYIDQINW